eukprot:43403-Pelagomonas_calceolata.AAC.1
MLTTWKIPADGFKLVIEYGPSFREYGEQHGGKVRLPKALATLELAWTSEESEAEVVERLAQVSDPAVGTQREESLGESVLSLGKRRDQVRKL